MIRKTWTTLTALTVLLTSASAFAEEGAAASHDPYASLAAALAIGLAAFGGSLAQAKVGAAALDGIARNPSAQGKIFVPMIIGLALIESLVLYAFVIAFVKIQL
ncbi:MAG: F0F1 ATP synthase subunit C [Bdellovibrionaceae bacterium]|nr:F0F1 ATP synthase subunit C [Pseudobdellovibrionaceae bacterium]|tara:strand:+ start:10025 stop:10336 length:312 start_codon:yes stop_codon:yes gene_type:complete